MNWLKQVADVQTPEDLLAAVNDYLLEQPDDFWSWIPGDCRPALVASEEDVHSWHRRLAEEVGRVQSPNIRLQDLCVFFVRASARALEMRASAERPSSNQRDFDSRSRPPGKRLS